MRNVLWCSLRSGLLAVGLTTLTVAKSGAQSERTVLLRIRSDSGHVLEGARVEVRRRGPDSLRVAARGQSDAAGQVTLRLPSEDSLQLRVLRIGYVAKQHLITGSLDADIPIDVTLEPQAVSLLQVCTTDVKWALNVVVAQAAADSTMTLQFVARDGAFIERVEAKGWEARQGISLAEERPGTYDVEVSARGFNRWRARGIRVDGTHCGPITRELRVRLRTRW